MGWKDYIPEDIADLYEVHDYKHAAAILSNEFPNEFNEIIGALRVFRLKVQDIIDKGGNESAIPKLVSDILRPLEWKEQQLKAEMVVDGKTVSADTHLVDYIKGRVAFDLEWNSKDQTYDRDLFAFRTFHEYGKISVGILLTRSNDLDDVFLALGEYTDKDGKVKKVISKFGASTTHMGKLLPRLDAGRGGGCPVLVFGITPQVLSDWKDHPKNVVGKQGLAKKNRRKYLRNHLG